jgi:hypothetical protein
MKTVNLIMYKPGYGGHLISFLMSLDNTTMPWLRNKVMLEYFVVNKQKLPIVYNPYSVSFNMESRKKMYSFTNASQDSWDGHHLSFAYEMHLLEYFLSTDNLYSSFTFSLHPYGFYVLNEGNMLYILGRAYGPVTINYCQVALSEKYEWVIDDFKKSNNGFPVLREGEDELNSKFAADKSPYIINFDNFILGEDSFIPEYEKLAAYLSIPAQIDDALDLYRDWYTSRNFPNF